MHAIDFSRRCSVCTLQRRRVRANCRECVLLLLFSPLTRCCDSARLAVGEMFHEIVKAVMSRPVNSIALSLRFFDTLLVFHCHSVERSFKSIMVSCACTPWPNGGELDTCFPVSPTRTVCSLFVVSNCPQPLAIVTGKWNISLMGWAFLVLPNLVGCCFGAMTNRAFPF